MITIKYNEKELVSLIRTADAICIGSGLGTSETSRKILNMLLKKQENILKNIYKKRKM